MPMPRFQYLPIQLKCDILFFQSKLFNQTVRSGRKVIIVNLFSSWALVLSKLLRAS